MRQAINRLRLSVQQSWAGQLLSVTVVSLLMFSIPVEVSRVSERCEGFRFLRDRSEHEAPLLPRQSIAARAVRSPDWCAQPRSADDRSGNRVEAVETVPNAGSPASSLPESDIRPQLNPSEPIPNSSR